jgi:hypothetical protein
MSIVNAEAELLAAAGPEADRHGEQPAPARRARWRWLPRSVPAPLAAGALAVGLLAGIAGKGAFDDGAGGTRVSQATFAANIGRAATAQLEVSDGHARLVGSHLPAPRRGLVYQVWVKRRGEANPEPTNALFTVTRSGAASVDVPGDVDDVETVMVTDEPPGGSALPTGSVLLSAQPA